jgi:hypothetical protein
MPSVQRISHDSEGRANKRGCLRIRLTASSFWLCLATHCGRVAESHLPHAVMSAGHFRLPRPTEAGLRPAMPQLLVSASTPLGTFGLGHSLEPTLPADLTTFAAYGGHICGQVLWRNCRATTASWFQDVFWLWRLFRGTIYDPLRKLVRIAGAFPFTDCHGFLGLGLSYFRRDICFSNSAASAKSVAACSFISTAAARNFSISRRNCSELGLSCGTARFSSLFMPLRGMDIGIPGADCTIRVKMFQQVTAN